MTSILRKIVQRFNAREPKGSGERVFVAAFGKHRGWDDHIDDIGIETDVLVAVKRILYIQGIGGNIDMGRWEKLERGRRAGKFGHVFVWCMAGETVVGRLWPSRDGKGRTSYPMIVCVQCSALPLSWVLQSIVTRLESLELACTAATSADHVRQIIAQAQDRFRQSALQCEPVPNPPVAGSDALARLAASAPMGPDRQGLLRILYHIDREALQTRRETDRMLLRPTLVRVPTASPASQEDALLWISFLLDRLGPDASILALMPLENPWIDIVVGEPTDGHLYCLRAPLGVIPLTSSIPYCMGSEFVARANQLIDDSQSDTQAQSLADRG